MDETETYIKMSDCPGIQALGDDDEQSFIWCSNHMDLWAYDSAQQRLACIHYDWPDGVPKLVGSGETSCITKGIRLSRQDQLQEMSGLDWQAFDKACLAPTFYFSTTKEIAGVQVVMKELHGKVWNGQGWA